MSIIRKLAVSAAGLIVGITGMVLTVGPANSVAECGWGTPTPCNRSAANGHY